MNKVAAFALRRKNSILSMSEKMFCPPQPLRFWITPACAGKRAALCRHRIHPKDHPRMCGEKFHLRWQLCPWAGSPPRVRGKACPPRPGGPGRRITPACAGKRPWFSGLFSPTGDHPRVCGEKIRRFSSARSKRGSPPRVRGKVHQEPQAPVFAGITPAYAGKSAACCSMEQSR